LDFSTFDNGNLWIIKTPEDLLKVKNNLEEINFKKFFNEVYLNKTWYKGSLMYKKYEEEDVGDTNEELNDIIYRY
jgi:hypothetical protein